ncbi:MAG: serine hydrolase [Myxococcota bacterium]
MRPARYALCALSLLGCVRPPDAPPADATSTPSSTDPTPTSTTPTPTSPPTTSEPAVDCDALAVREDDRDTWYESNPTYVDPADRSGPYPTLSPEDAGLDEVLLQRATDALDGVAFVESLLVFHGGALGWEAYLHGAGPQDSHNVHSASKSILAAAAGIALARGQLDLDATVASYLPDAFAEQEEPEKAEITVRQLMTMTSGLQWAEDRAEYRIDDQPDWVRAIVGRPMAALPGAAFNYSTANTHLLSAVLQAATGTSTCAFVHEVLFAPLDIAAEHWGRDPQRVSSGGYNVYLTPRELARFGLLVAARGQWDGEALLDPAWVDEMFAPVGRDGAYRYGHLWWLRQISGYDVQIAWGYGGQLVYLVDALDLVVVVTTNTGDYDPGDFDIEWVLERDLIPAVL